MSDTRKPKPNPQVRRKVVLAAQDKTPDHIASILEITVGEGSDSRIFRIPETLLTHRARYFTGSMNVGMVEARTKAVSLPHQDPEIFDLYQKYLYHRVIPVFHVEPHRWLLRTIPCRHIACDKPYLCHKEYQLLVELYLLVDYLVDEEAMNAVVDAIISKVTHERHTMHVEEPCMPPSLAVRAMWERTPNHCAGRQVLLDCFVWYGTYRSIARGMIGVPRVIKEEVLYNVFFHWQRPVDPLLHNDMGRKPDYVDDAGQPKKRRRIADTLEAGTLEDEDVVSTTENDGTAEVARDNGDAGRKEDVVETTEVNACSDTTDAKKVPGTTETISDAEAVDSDSAWDMGESMGFSDTTDNTSIPNLTDNTSTSDSTEYDDTKVEIELRNAIEAIGKPAAELSRYSGVAQRMESEGVVEVRGLKRKASAMGVGNPLVLTRATSMVHATG